MIWFSSNGRATLLTNGSYESHEPYILGSTFKLNQGSLREPQTLSSNQKKGETQFLEWDQNSIYMITNDLQPNFAFLAAWSLANTNSFNSMELFK